MRRVAGTSSWKAIERGVTRNDGKVRCSNCEDHYFCVSGASRGFECENLVCGDMINIAVLKRLQLRLNNYVFDGITVNDMRAVLLEKGTRRCEVVMAISFIKNDICLFSVCSSLAFSFTT